MLAGGWQAAGPLGLSGTQVFPGILTRSATPGSRGSAPVLAAARARPGQDSLARDPIPRAHGHSSQPCLGPLGRQGSDRDVHFSRGCRVWPAWKEYPSIDLRDRLNPSHTPTQVRMGGGNRHKLQHRGQRPWGPPREGHGAGPQLPWGPHEPDQGSDRRTHGGSGGSPGRLQDRDCLGAPTLASQELGKSRQHPDLSLLICEMGMPYRAVRGTKEIM